jgi:FkbM family methyltransferase
MTGATRGMFSTLLRTQQLLMSLGVSRVIRRIPLAYPAYAFLYRRWAPRGEVCVEAHGHKLFLDPRDLGMARAFLLFRGQWEETETGLFCSLVKEGMTVVDVGANVGYYTLLAARLVGNSGRVFSFEPSPENFALLKRNVEANGYDNVVLVPKAVSDASGTAKLSLDRSSSGGHGLSDFRGGPDTVEVETVSLDEYFAGRGHRVDLLKVDAEGAEMAIFRGMQRVVAQSSHLVLLTEFFPRAIRSFGHRPEDYVRQLAGCGFRIHPIDEDRGRIETLDPDRVSEFIEPLVAKRARKDVLNLLCLKGNGAVEYGEAVR